MIPNQSRPGTVALLFSSAQHMGLRPEWITHNGLFVIKTATGERYVNHERSSLNSHVSVSLTRNKYHARKIMERHNLPNIPYTRAHSLEEAKKFLARHGAIIAKPLRGSGSVDVHIIRHVSALKELSIAGYILERYMPGKEMRYLVLEGEVIGVHESRYGDSVAPDRALERISYGTAEWDQALVDLSLDTARVLGLSFAAVDYMISDNEAYILEANSRPGFKWFHAPSYGPAVDVATMFLEAMLGTQRSVHASSS